MMNLKQQSRLIFNVNKSFDFQVSNQWFCKWSFAFCLKNQQNQTGQICQILTQTSAYTHFIKFEFPPPLRADFLLSQSSNQKPDFDSNFGIYSFHSNQLQNNFGRPCGRIRLYLKLQTENQNLTLTLAYTQFTKKSKLK